MAGETLSFDIFARLREDGFAKAGKAASAATDDVLNLAKRLDELSKKSATARVGLAGDKEALAQLDKLDLKLLTTGRRVVDPKITLDGAAKAQAEIAGLEVSLDKLGTKSANVTAAVGSGPGGLAGPAGMGALIGAGVALSPILATVATGTAGFGLAAAGAVAPILKASKATGGLQANMAKLNPEQQKLAGSILGLGKQYDAFQKSLEPQVLTVFGTAIRTAGHLMSDVQPVAAATGKALNTMLGAIDDEFQSGAWQNFFGFMARTAGPDIQLLTNNFTDFLQILPPLLQDLQPVATGILQLTDDVLKLTGAVIKASDAERHLASEAHNSSGFLGELAHAAEGALGQFVPGVPAAQKMGQALSKQAEAASKAAPGLRDVTSALGGAVTAADAAATSVDGLTAAMAKNIGVVLTLQGDEISWQQSLQAASKQLDSNSAGLRGNSKDALANKAAVLQSSQAVVAFADDQLKLGGDLSGASKRIQDQIHWLQVHGGKSRFARDEIHALRMEENKLQDTIRQKLLVSASGFWKVTGALSGGAPQAGGGPHAARGAFIRTGQPGVDDQLIMAQRGELVVPTRMVSARAGRPPARHDPRVRAGRRDRELLRQRGRHAEVADEGGRRHAARRGRGHRGGDGGGDQARPGGGQRRRVRRCPGPAAAPRRRTRRWPGGCTRKWTGRRGTTWRCGRRAGTSSPATPTPARTASRRRCRRRRWARPRTRRSPTRPRRSTGWSAT